MIYGELGRYPLSIKIEKRIIGFWANITGSKQNSLSKMLYVTMLDSNYRSNWHNKIKSILDTIGLSDKWTHQNFLNKNG